MVALHKHTAWKSGKEFQREEKHHLFSVTVNTFLPLSLFKSLDSSPKPSLLLQHYIALYTHFCFKIHLQIYLENLSTSSFSSIITENFSTPKYNSLNISYFQMSVKKKKIVLIKKINCPSEEGIFSYAYQIF